VQNSAELQAVNESLERGEGWIGYLFLDKPSELGIPIPLVNLPSDRVAAA